MAGLLLGPWSGAAALSASVALLFAAAGTAWAERRGLVPERRGSAGERGGAEAEPRGSALRLGAALLLASVAIVAGAAVGQARLAALDRTELRPWFGHAADVRLTLLEAPRRRSFGRVVALARVERGPGRGERVLVRAAARLAGRGLSAGVQLRARGGWRPLPDFEQAARRRGAHALLAARSLIRVGRRGGVLGAIDAVRRRSDRALTAGLPPPLGALARGMVLGEDEALDDRMRDDFRASGLAHLVAASGANVALLAALVLGLCAVVGVPLRARLALTLAVVVAYVPLAGGGPSIQRAGAMGAAGLVAALASRPASRWYALLLAAAATLAANPRSAGDPGWQMSFAAVVALLLLTPPLRARLATRLPRAAADVVAISLAASAGTAPLIAAHFGRVSLVGVPANVLAAPAVAPVMWLGVLGAVAGQVSAAAATPFTALAAWPLAFIAEVGHAAAGAPFAQARWAASPAAVAVWWAALLALAVPAVRRRLRRLIGVGRGTPAARAALVAACVGLLVAGLVPVRRAAGSAPPNRLVVSALDVGQGDATLVQHGSSAILVDTGPPDGPILRRLREAGVRRLDVLVVTHAQADHEGGAAAVLDALPVGLVLDGRDGVPSPDGARFAAAARRHGVRLLAPAAGQRIRAGPLALDVLSPRPEPAAAHAGEDPNQRAIVAVLRDGGFSMLLTADAESDVTSALPLEPVDVLKIAHHGSADPGLPALLARLRPAVALVEVGRHNVYGHPAPATLAALRSVPTVLRTDRDGTIRLLPGPRGIGVEDHP